ncbi:potassium-transporting ATPase [Calothrix sp. HK-06]|nr:potassium-transporting ATPase [Calothrix sp. HK-06]
MSYFSRKKLPIIIFFITCFNIVIVPVVYAATGKLEPRHTYALVGLGIITLGLVIYLFDVVFRPDRY